MRVLADGADQVAQPVEHGVERGAEHVLPASAVAGLQAQVAFGDAARDRGRVRDGLEDLLQEHPDEDLLGHERGQQKHQRALDDQAGVVGIRGGAPKQHGHDPAQQERGDEADQVQAYDERPARGGHGRYHGLR